MQRPRQRIGRAQARPDRRDTGCRLGEVELIPDDVVVDGIRNRAREEEHVRHDLGALPILREGTQPVQFPAQVLDHLAKRGKGVETPKVAAIETPLCVQQHRSR